jgi:hypothetical protein
MNDLLSNWPWMLLAVLLLSGAVCALVVWLARREAAFSAVAGKWGANFYPMGSADAEMRFWVDEQGNARSEIGQERPPLVWKEVEMFPLFQLATEHGRKQGRTLRNIADLTLHKTRITCFEYEVSETFDKYESDDPGWTMNTYYVFRTENAKSLPEWPNWRVEAAGTARIVYRAGLPSPKEIDEKLGQLIASNQGG